LRGKKREKKKFGVFLRDHRVKRNAYRTEHAAKRSLEEKKHAYLPRGRGCRVAENRVVARLRREMEKNQENSAGLVAVKCGKGIGANSMKTR